MMNMNLDLDRSEKDNYRVNILNSVKILSFTRSFRFLEKLIDKNKILGVDSCNKTDYLNKIKIFSNVLTDLHKDNWDFLIERTYVDNHLTNEESINLKATINNKLDKYSKNRLSQEGKRFVGYRLVVQILYKNIILKNSRGEKHKIKDFIILNPIKIIRNTDKVIVILSNILGSKATYYSEEYKTGFTHSHLPSRSGSHSRLVPYEFCTGASEHGSLSHQVESNFCKESVTMFYLHLNTMVAWESLEGTPYNEFSKLLYGIYKYAVPTRNRVRDNLLRLIINDKKKIDIDLCIQNKKIIIKNNKKFLDFLIPYAMNSPDVFLTKFDGVNYRLYNTGNEQNQINQIEGRIPFTYIRGKKLVYRILNKKNTTTYKNNSTIHPIVLNLIKKEYEQFLHKTYIRKYIINK